MTITTAKWSLDEYHRMIAAGILRAMQVIVFRNPQNGEYTSQQTFTSGTIAPLAFSDLAIAIEAILNP